MNSRALFLFLFCSFSCIHADQVSAHAFAKKYASRILTLRHAFKSNSQRYNAAGESIKPEKEGPWTLYGRLQVTQIKLRNGELEIRGRRTGLVNDADCLSDYGVGQSPLKLPEPIGNIVTIRIQISSPYEIQPAIAKVFALTEDDLLASVPDLWKDYVRSRLDPHSHDGQWEFTQGQADIARFSNTPSPVVTSGPATGATAAKATPPKPLFTPEPNYAGEIGHALVRGLDKIGATIDEHGNVASLAVIEPIGLGVDESAVEAMQKWKFEPSQLNGKPVAINMILEMSYKLLK